MRRALPILLAAALVFTGVPAMAWGLGLSCCRATASEATDTTHAGAATPHCALCSESTSAPAEPADRDAPVRCDSTAVCCVVPVLVLADSTDMDLSAGREPTFIVPDAIVPIGNPEPSDHVPRLG